MADQLTLNADLQRAIWDMQRAIWDLQSETTVAKGQLEIQVVLNKELLRRVERIERFLTLEEN
jgi:hypothetical protein